jgi:single-stranded DNA-binding protein
MDTNLVVLTGRLVSAAERAVGQSGRPLTELRLAVARLGRTGEREPPTVIPVTVWAGDVGAAVCGRPEGTPVRIVARLQSREWNQRVYVEVVAETVSVDVTAPLGTDAAPARRPVARAAPRAAADDDAPF